MILLAELMILVFLGTLAVQGVDFRENHACQNRCQTAMIQGVDFGENHVCQNRRQTNIILLTELMIFMVLNALAFKSVALVSLGLRKPHKIRVPGKVWV